MSFILTADWHLRSQRPRCRLDDNWLETQKNALAQIAAYAGQYEADGVFAVGDIFHSTNETTNEIIGLVQEFALMLCDLDTSLYLLAGNHDLPQHNLENIHRSAFSILLNSKNIFHIRDSDYFAEYGYKHSASDFGVCDENAQVIFKHVLCFPENEKIPPGSTIVRPSELYALYGNAKYIFTGDYHRQFVYVKGKKKLFNPGCLLRQAADMIDYEPSVFLIDADKNGEFTHTICPIHDNERLVTDLYLEKEEERNDRIDAFIERIKDNEKISFDFVENVHNSIQKNKMSENIKKRILELLEGQ